MAALTRAVTAIPTVDVTLRVRPPPRSRDESLPGYGKTNERCRVTTKEHLAHRMIEALQRAAPADREHKIRAYARALGFTPTEIEMLVEEPEIFYWALRTRD